MDTKLCVICNKIKTIDNFYKSQRGRKCIDCVLEMARKYKKNRRSNPDFRKIEGQKQKEWCIKMSDIQNRYLEYLKLKYNCLK